MQDEHKKILLEWWKELEKDRGGRAELRRARSPDDVVFCPAYHRLYAQMHWPEKDRDKLAAITGLAAHVKDHDESRTLPQQMAARKNGDSALVSGLRFRRILAIDDRNDLYLNLIRVLRMLDGKANLLDLAESVYWWNRQTKKEWAYQYFAIAKNER